MANKSYLSQVVARVAALSTRYSISPSAKRSFCQELGPVPGGGFILKISPDPDGYAMSVLTSMECQGRGGIKRGGHIGSKETTFRTGRVLKLIRSPSCRVSAWEKKPRIQRTVTGQMRNHHCGLSARGPLGPFD